MPLFLRISATDWLEEAPKDQVPESWTVEDTVKLAPLLAERGVDLLDVSSGGNHPLQHPHAGPAYQAPFAVKVKKVVGDKMAVGTVGMLENAHVANDVLEKDGLDLAIVGRGFQKNPGLVSAPSSLGTKLVTDLVFRFLHGPMSWSRTCRCPIRSAGDSKDEERRNQSQLLIIQN
jgi:2,4-dienoyl-CoA reductase-like NADH-dependent reductase (Old Yellow Enzyme family)